MKIRLSIVRPDILAQVRIAVSKLQKAIWAGDMDAADAATDKLISLTANCRSVDLSERDWRRFLSKIRNSDPSFESGYLLSGEICADILPTVTANDFVLELPIDSEETDENDL